VSSQELEADRLSVEELPAYLERRGVAAAVRSVDVLEGGVSNDVYAVSADSRRLVVKQSCARLRVADEWVATRERTLNEAAALRFVRALTPEHVPEVVDLDEERIVLVIEGAPATWPSWKALLLDGMVDLGVATTLGRVLAEWQRGSRVPPTDPRLDDLRALAQLRLEPYHLTTAERHPDLSDRIGELVAQLRERRVSFVHGDFSPKNVLVGERVWVIDFEVAHYGNPAFDVAFLLSHLALKTVARPADAVSYAEAARGFWTTYREHGGAATDFAEVGGHAAALLLARVDGKSPAEYLDAGGQAAVRDAARSLLRTPPETVEALWSALP
jgi:5-methylthioribose kinase